MSYDQSALIRPSSNISQWYMSDGIASEDIDEVELSAMKPSPFGFWFLKYHHLHRSRESRYVLAILNTKHNFFSNLDSQLQHSLHLIRAISHRNEVFRDKNLAMVLRKRCPYASLQHDD